MKHKKQKISQAFQHWLAVLVVIAFLVTTSCLWVIQTNLSKDNAVHLLELNIADVRQDIIDASDKNLLDLALQIKKEISAAKSIGKTIDANMLHALTEEYDVVEINVVDASGIITASTYPAFFGYDMSSGAQSAEFLVLLDGTQDEYAQSYHRHHAPERGGPFPQRFRGHHHGYADHCICSPFRDDLHSHQASGGG